MSSESTSPDDHGKVDATVSTPQPSPPSDVSTQEIGGSTNASDITAMPLLVQEVPRNGTTASTVRAINNNDSPIPVGQVAGHEKETKGPQLHDGPPGPPRFSQELDDDTLAKILPFHPRPGASAQPAVARPATLPLPNDSEQPSSDLSDLLATVERSEDSGGTSPGDAGGTALIEAHRVDDVVYEATIVDEPEDRSRAEGKDRTKSLVKRLGRYARAPFKNSGFKLKFSSQDAAAETTRTGSGGRLSGESHSDDSSIISNAGGTASDQVPKLRYDADANGWERVLLIDDTHGNMYQWVNSNDDYHSYYVRKIHSSSVELVPPEDGLVSPTAQGDGGDIVLEHSEIASTIEKNIDDKLNWLRSKLDQKSNNPVRVSVRREGLLIEAMFAILHLSREDLRRQWNFEVDGETVTACRFFALASAELFNPELGLWAIDSSGFYTINPLSGLMFAKMILSEEKMTYRLHAQMLRHLLGWPVASYDPDQMAIEGDEIEWLRERVYCQYESQLEQLLLGFTEIIDECYLIPFSHKELELMLIDGRGGAVISREPGITQSMMDEAMAGAKEYVKSLDDEVNWLSVEVDPSELSRLVSLRSWPVQPGSRGPLPSRGVRMDGRIGNKWRTCQVISGPTAMDDTIHVHFDGTEDRHDVSLTIEDFSTGRVCPLYTREGRCAGLTEFTVYFRGADQSKSAYLFGHPFQVQCRTEWSLARATASILRMSIEHFSLHHFNTRGSGSTFLKTDLALTKALSESLAMALLDVDNSNLRLKLIPDSGETASIPEAICKKMDILPFEIRVVRSGAPLGTGLKEANLPCELNRSVGNYFSPHMALALHWRDWRDFEEDERQRFSLAEIIRDQGDEALSSGNISKAISLYTRALELKPDDFQALYSRSDCFLKSGDPKEAKRDLMQVIMTKHQKPLSAKDFYLKGAAMCSVDQHHRAESLFKEGLTQFPGDQDLMYGLQNLCRSEESESSKLGHRIQHKLNQETSSNGRSTQEGQGSNGDLTKGSHSNASRPGAVLVTPNGSDLLLEQKIQQKLLEEQDANLNAGNDAYRFSDKPTREHPGGHFLIRFRDREEEELVDYSDDKNDGDGNLHSSQNVRQAHMTSRIEELRDILDDYGSTDDELRKMLNDNDRAFENISLCLTSPDDAKPPRTASSELAGLAERNGGVTRSIWEECNQPTSIKSSNVRLPGVLGGEVGDAGPPPSRDAMPQWGEQPGQAAPLAPPYLPQQTLRKDCSPINGLAVDLTSMTIHNDNATMVSAISMDPGLGRADSAPPVHSASASPNLASSERSCEPHVANNNEVNRRSQCDGTVVDEVAQAPAQFNDEDEDLDVLTRLALDYARRCNHIARFVLRDNGQVGPNEMIFTDSRVEPSDLTLDTYFRTTGTRRRQVLESINEGEASGDVSEEQCRIRLVSVLENLRADPVQLSPRYVSSLRSKPETILGGGFYGEVVLGVDQAINHQFAIKLVNPLAIEESFAGRIKSIHKSFQNEIRILSRLSHPNIAKLYGYCMEAGLENTCLIYEYARNGSLDRFWASRLGRARLSDAKIRCRIALEVAIVLKYMHEGVGENTRCFHRDIKSGNVCLTTDFRVRVIDCGLGKYVTEQPGSFSSGGPSGTPGYTCPHYLMGGCDYESACDIFSVGVLLCDLITGSSSSKKSQHYFRYKTKTTKGGGPTTCLVENADECADWEGISLKCLADLALRCMESIPADRPDVVDVIRDLHQIIDGGASTRGREEIARDDPTCQLWIGSARDIAVKTTRELISKDGCPQDKFVFEQRMMPVIENRLGQLLELQVKLCAGNGLPCPKLFILKEAGETQRWRHPANWGGNNLYLYFVCSHSGQMVTDKARITLKYSTEWLKSVAPALKASLEILKSSLDVSQIRGDSSSIVDSTKVLELNEWVKQLLDDNQRQLFEESKSNTGDLSCASTSSLQTLVGNALSYVAEKAASANINWQSEMTPVLDNEKKEPTFVMHKYALDPAYTCPMESAAVEA